MTSVRPPSPAGNSSGELYGPHVGVANLRTPGRTIVLSDEPTTVGSLAPTVTTATTAMSPAIAPATVMPPVSTARDAGNGGDAERRPMTKKAPAAFPKIRCRRRPHIPPGNYTATAIGPLVYHPHRRSPSFEQRWAIEVDGAPLIVDGRPCVLSQFFNVTVDALGLDMKDGSKLARTLRLCDLDTDDTDVPEDAFTGRRCVVKVDSTKKRTDKRLGGPKVAIDPKLYWSKVLEIIERIV